MKKLKTRARSKRFISDVSTHTPFAKMLLLLIALWLVFSAGMYFSEQHAEGSSILTYGDALYWGIAAFSTAGIADSPISGLSQLVGGLWIIIGSTLFFGTIVATVTTYFMRPMQRPHRKIIDAIEYNLEQLGDLSVDELDLLKETMDTLIIHVERMKKESETQ
jgi:voltage-gated potassium channel